MHNPSISILGPGPDVILIEGFDCIFRVQVSTIMTSNKESLGREILYKSVCNNQAW